MGRKQSSTDEPRDEERERKIESDKEPWHRPQVHRLQIEDTASSPATGGGIPGG